MAAPVIPEGFELEQPAIPDGFVVETPKDNKLGPWTSAVLRPIAQGIMGLPNMIADVGVAARNRIEGKNESGQWPYWCFSRVY
jgi:hypothetical protein